MKQLQAFKDDVDVEFNNVIGTVHCFGGKKSISYQPFEFCMDIVNNDGQELTRIILYLQRYFTWIPTTGNILHIKISPVV